MMDFETAIKNAILSLFPDVCVKHCLFHLYQSVYKRVQKEQLKRLWVILDVKMVLRCLPALSFLHIGEVKNGFDELLAKKCDLISRQIIPRDSIAHFIIRAFAYFEKNDVRRPNGNDFFYPLSLRNMHNCTINGLPRTNSGVENWNGQFNNYFHHRHPALADVIFKLQVDEEKTRQNMETRSRNPVSRITGGKRSHRAIFSDNQIRQLVEIYRNGTGLPRMEFSVSIAAHLEKYQSH